MVEVSGKVGRHFPYNKIVNATSALLSAIDTYVQNILVITSRVVEMVYHRLTDGHLRYFSACHEITPKQIGYLKRSNFPCAYRTAKGPGTIIIFRE